MRRRLYEIFSENELKILFKIHGTIEDMNGIVLSKDDYKKLYSTDMQDFHLSFIKPVLSKTLFFIGFGCKDPGVMSKIKLIANLFDGFKGNHYALVEKKKDDTQDQSDEISPKELFNDYKINIIEYSDHSEIIPFLSKLNDKIDNYENTKDIKPPEIDTKNHFKKKHHIRTLSNCKLIPDCLRHRSIGECIVLHSAIGENALNVWKYNDLELNIQPNFYRPPKILKEIQKSTIKSYERLGYSSSPRVSLVNIQKATIEKRNFQNTTITATLTDWALVDGIQLIQTEKHSRNKENILKRFWNSVESLASNGRCRNFPHHLVVHCLLISSDNKVILNKRAGVSNQRGRISASFEEQLQFAYLDYHHYDNQEPEYNDGDLNLVDAVLRGAEEELGIELQRQDVLFLAICMESASVAANVLSLVKSQLSAKDIYSHWQKAHDKEDNVMIPPHELPAWEIESIVPLLDEWNSDNGIKSYGGPWHASSPARLVLGMIYEFGFDEVAKYVDLSFLSY